MLDVLLDVVTTGALFFVVGIPAAFCLRRTTGGWASFVVDSLAGGVVIGLLGVALYSWIGWAGAVIVAAMWLVAVLVCILTRPGLPVLWHPHGCDWALVAGWVVVILAAVALRLRSVNFLPWVGDMGAYVNWANEFARTGALSASWPPLFSSYLAISARLFGPAFTTAGVPLAGLLLIFVVARVTSALGAGRWATLVAAAAVTVSVHAIWFSSFPASESLNAPLFLVWIGTILGILGSSGRLRVTWLVASGVAMLALGLVRGDGPILLLPFGLLAILSLIVPDWRGIARALWLTFTASTAGALVSYWYGIQRIPHYYVTNQVGGLLPGSLFTLLSRLGVFLPTPRTAIVLILATGVVCTVGLLIARRVAPLARTTVVPRRLGYVLGAALLLGIAANAVVGGEVWHIILREGLWLTIALVLLVAIVGRARLPAPVVAFVLFLGTAAAFFLALQSYRLRTQDGHAFFMYWDRYLFSEFIPIAFIVFGLALTVAWTLWGERVVARLLASVHPFRRAVPVVAVVVLAVAVVVPTVPQLVLVEKDTFLAGAYQLDVALGSLIPSTKTPVLWSASRGFTVPATVPGFVFPNTWMAFAKPLDHSFGYDVTSVGTRASDIAPDEVLTATLLEQGAVCEGTSKLVVFESEVGGPTLAERVVTPGIEFRDLGTRSGVISLLSQPPKNGDWTHFHLRVRAWSVTISPSLTAGVSCPVPAS